MAGATWPVSAPANRTIADGADTRKSDHHGRNDAVSDDSDQQGASPA